MVINFRYHINPSIYGFSINMKLSSFITTQMETILTEWEAFARTLGPAATNMTDTALRDHAKQILQAVAKDIESKQSAEQQSDKSKGLQLDQRDSAASEHGKIREEDGFTMIQMVAEYRALRATVLRLWLPQVKQMTDESTNDMVRFNESLDQAVAESTARFTEQAARTRDTFLAILGHDLRTPLAAMAMAGDYLMMPNVGTSKTAEAGSRVKRSAAAMSAMVNDLLEFARTQLGGGIPVARNEVEVKSICQSAIDEMKLAHPECQIELNATANLVGLFDFPRLRQALINLLTNAAQYRAKEHPVRLSASEENDEIIIQVQNQGPVIPSDSLEAIFNPLVQLAGDGNQEGRPSTSLGLGLFIAREIAEAHNGSITAESNEKSGTVFTIRLPRTFNP